MEDLEKIAVLGGGNLCQMMAADLSHRGFRVSLCEHPHFEKNIRMLARSRQIKLSGKMEFTQEIDTVTTNFGKALSDAGLVVLPIPAFAQKPMLERAIPHLEDGQLVVFSPGNFGSLAAAQILKRRKVRKKVILGETSGGLYFARILEPCKIHVIDAGYENWFSAFPARDNKKAFDVFKTAFPHVKLGENVVSVAMLNGNYPVHSGGSILNAGAIEFADMALPPWPKELYYVVHIHGISPRVAKVVTTVFEEILAVRKALGYAPPPSYSKEAFYKEKAYAYKNPEKLSRGYGPQGLDDRYITEDMPYGLAPIIGLADTVGVPVPTMRALLHLASVLNEVDYMRKGRGIKELGIAGMKPKRLKKFLNEGK